MRNALITLGAWLATDRLLEYFSRDPAADQPAEQLPPLSPEDCEGILREIVEAEYPYLTDLAQMVQPDNRETLKAALTNQAHYLETAVCAKHNISLKAFAKIWKAQASENEKLALLGEEVKAMFQTAIQGFRTPLMPSLLGYSETITPEERDITYEIIADLNRRFRLKIIEAVEEDLAQCKDSLPTSADDATTYALQPVIRDKVRRVLRETQAEELARRGVPSNRYLHNIAVLANDSESAGHLRILTQTHKKILFDALVQIQKAAAESS